MAFACGVLFGTLPAIIASRANIAATASDRAAGRRIGRLRQALVAVEVGVAIVLVAGAALLGQTLAHVVAVDPGFQAAGVVTARISLPPARYAESSRVDAFYRTLLERVRGIPGVRAAGTIQALPLSGSTSVRPYRVFGRPAGTEQTLAHYRIVSPGYIEAMRIPLRAGRTFTDQDAADRPPVVLVNETLKREAWGGRDPIGSRITFGGSNDRWAEVVGVVGDVHHLGPGTPPAAEMYWPVAQVGVVNSETLNRVRRQATLVVSTIAGDSLSVVPAIRDVLSSVDRAQPIADVQTMAALVDSSLWLSRAAAWLLTLLGGAALLFALLGVFGSAAYAVAQRRRELALRLALGAAPAALEQTVLMNALKGAAAGVILGVGIALVVRQSVAALLVGVSASDPRTLALASAALLGCAAFASWIPARRAARIEPMAVLRDE